ncbi:RING-type domain-containing protein [Caenorhabditis elegans]|uniref:RING-type domain-containing protein n=1 Tax=Caenorhabditis elegans TaxID=6239 RepID=G1K0U6_CAEEL|nr:RING-type domain-containing protein [Caenorhabditis elegans]CCD61917.1 RING-type domain-containing protein [Caenorhabditis elegans]|eukprot:NP_001257072.1 Uncharacterized protein CELE_B0416.10 [Caenorhabditis elegans]
MSAYFLKDLARKRKQVDSGNGTDCCFKDGHLIWKLCELCLVPFDRSERMPKVLACGHTLCVNCMKENSSAGFALCPLDRTGSKFDGSSTHDFPTNNCLLDA